MTKEDKDLLLKDLSARLPYGVIVQYKGHNSIVKNKLLTGSDLDCNMEYYKPYLRPMSSMTEKDCLSLSKELNLSIRARGGDIYFPHNEDNTLENWSKVNNWLLKNHFDFIGLISKGLAIEVTETNNIYKD